MKHPVTATAFCISLLALSGCAGEHKVTAQKSLRPVQVTTIEHNSQQQMRRYSGVLASAETANLAFRVPGTIDEIYVNAGDTVTQGQVLAKLDQHDYQVVVLELEARLDEAIAAQHLATTELKRVRQASAGNAIASVKLDRAESGKKRADAAVKVVKQNLKKAQDALRYTELKAPFDGVIGRRMLDQFEQTAPAISVFTLHKPSQLEAVVDVPESQISGFYLGLSGDLKWHRGEQTYRAMLNEVATIPDPIKQTYQVKFTVDQLPNDILPGRAIQLTLPYTLSGDMNYCVPHSALKIEGEQAYVYRVVGQTAHSMMVDVVSQNKQSVCIDADLDQGDQIITAGVHFINDGQAVGRLITQ